MQTLACKRCGGEFHAYPSQKRVFCSSECSSAHQHESHVEKNKRDCQVCGEEFVPVRVDTPGLYCSYKCSGVAMRKERVNREGYWYVCKPEHPRGHSQGYVPEHVLVMEKHIGRFLRDGEVVHHIDHDRKNNDISNLQLMTDSEHKAHHAKERDRGASSVFI